jgi:uncharacterized membrane protein YdbT with pleckstrin-like domain
MKKLLAINGAAILSTITYTIAAIISLKSRQPEFGMLDVVAEAFGLLMATAVIVIVLIIVVGLPFCWLVDLLEKIQRVTGASIKQVVCASLGSISIIVFLSHYLYLISQH